MTTLPSLLKELREKANAASAPDRFRAYPTGMKCELMRGMDILGSHNHTPYLVKENAEFIESARTSVPLLLDLLEEAIRSLENITFMADDKQPIEDAVDHAQEAVAKTEKKAKEHRNA